MKKEKVKIYILSLTVDQSYGPGSTTDSQWISTNRAEIEKKKETEMKRLLDYFGIEPTGTEEIEDCVKCEEEFIDMKSKELGKKDWKFEELLDMDAISQEEYEEFLKNREKCSYDKYMKDAMDDGAPISICGCNHENLENGVAYEIYSIEAQIEELERTGVEYGNRSLDSFPQLYIEEVEVTKKVKEF